jgi:transcriptional regulator with XRE-family HTH domain
MRDQPEIKIEEKLCELLAITDASNSEIAQEIGVSTSSITQYRQGQTRPSLDKLVALADVLDVSLDYLVLGDDTGAEEIDTGPIVRYMDQSLQDAQIRTAEHTALVAHVGRRLSQMLDEEVDKFLSEDPGRRLYDGMITDTETEKLEGHSEKSKLTLLDFSYNMIDVESETPGRFFTTVANNLSQGREYQYLLPENVDIDWPSVTQNFRDLLIKQINSEVAVRENCSFRITGAPIFSGSVLYHLSEDDLKRDDPILYDYLCEKDYVTNTGWIGYTTPPSLGGRGEPLMDDDHLARAIALFDDIWEEADPI